MWPVRIPPEAILRRRSSCIHVDSDHEVEGQDVHCRQWCFSAHDESKFSYTAGMKDHEDNKRYLEIQTASGIVGSTREAKFYIRELGTYLYMKLVEYFSVGIVNETAMRCIGMLLLVATARESEVDERKEDSCTTKCRTVCGGSTSISYSILGFSLQRPLSSNGEPCARKRRKGGEGLGEMTPRLQVAEPLSTCSALVAEMTGWEATVGI